MADERVTPESAEQATSPIRIDRDLIEKLQPKLIEVSAKSEGVMLSSIRQIDDSVQSLNDENAAAMSLWGVTPRDISNDNAPWEMFLGALRQKIGGATSFQGVQILTVPQNADWHNPTTGNYIAWRVLADSIPKWDGVYIPTPITATRGYQVFLTNLAIPAANPDDERNVRRARDKYEEALDDLEEAYAAMGDKWIHYRTLFLDHFEMDV